MRPINNKTKNIHILKEKIIKCFKIWSQTISKEPKETQKEFQSKQWFKRKL